MRTDLARALALSLALAARTAAAQDAAAPAAPPADASTTAPGPVDPTQPLPPGHVPVDSADPHGGDPHGGDPHGGDNIHRARLPESYARESAELPPGVVVVRVVDARGTPQPEVMVRVGAMREGEVAGAQEVRTGLDGTARIERMATDGTMAYRLSTERNGARFGAPPFQLPLEHGYEVQLVRHEVTDQPRGVLLWEARAEVRFKDDRAVFVLRFKLVNLSAMSLGDGGAQPTAFVPPAGIRFPLPSSYTAFVTQPSMGDQRLTEEGGAAVFRGSVPPTTTEPLDIVYQFQVKLEGGDVALSLPMPLPVVSATVITEAPPGLTLAVDGMPTAEARQSEGQRVLLTGLERRPNDPHLASLNVRLGGIPAAAGPARLAASAGAGAIVLGALGYALSRRRQAASKRPRAAAESDRDRLLAEMRELAALHRDGEVGPQTFARRRRELATALALLLKELDEAAA